MLKTNAYLTVHKDGDDFLINKIQSIEWENSVKNFGQQCKVKIPLKDIDFNGDNISYDKMVINLYDEVTVIMKYDDVNVTPNRNESQFIGFVTDFIITKTNITLIIDDHTIILKKMNRVKISIKDATIVDILEKICGGYTTSKGDGTFTVTTGFGSLKINYIDIEFVGNFLNKDPLTPYEIIKLITEEMQLDTFSIPNEMFIGRPVSFDDAYEIDFAYPYVDGYNYIIDVNIDQHTNDLTEYMVRATSVIDSKNKNTLAYGVPRPTIDDPTPSPTYIQYKSSRDNTIQMKFPNVTVETLKVLTQVAWDKLITKDNKSGSFLTFGTPQVNLYDDIKINLYGEESTYNIMQVTTSFDTSKGIRQDIKLGKKLS